MIITIVIIPGETFSLFHFGAGTIKLEIALKERKWMRKFFDTFDDVIEDGDEDVMIMMIMMMTRVTMISTSSLIALSLGGGGHTRDSIMSS